MKKYLCFLCVIVLFLCCSGCSKEQLPEDVKTSKRYAIELRVVELRGDHFIGSDLDDADHIYAVYYDSMDALYCVGELVKVIGYKRAEREENVIALYPNRIREVEKPLDEGTTYVGKPVIYLYPQEECDIAVKMELSGYFTHTVPGYGQGWQVTARPDGTILHQGSEYPYLFWEAVLEHNYDFSRGFCVPGDQTEVFLREKLAILGLQEKEILDFLAYWLPLMEQNAYNLIAFQSEGYTDYAKLKIDPIPDTLIRVLMAYYPLEEPVDILPQELTAVVRYGYTVVEWGGSRMGD